MHPRRIILMYISEVSGHHSATLAIEKALKILQPSVEVMNINAFNYTNPISERVVNRLYLGIIKRTPKIWDYLYDNPRIVKKVANIKAAIHRANSVKFQRLFDKFKPDAVLCSQAFPCGMVADYKRTFNSDMPLIAVLTDYIPHAYWVYDTIDYYIVPSDDIMHRLAKKGVSQEKIKPLGIPFNPEFNGFQDKEKIRHKLKLHPGSFTILIMGGGQGLGPIKTIVKSLEGSKHDIQEIIVTGTNKRLFRSLKRKIKKYKKKILLYGYADNMHELMAASDIIITKPGGVTTAEVLSQKLPMVIVKPLPGQEANNTSYLIEKNAAIKVERPQETHLAIEELVWHPGRIEHMRRAASQISKPYASMDIARLLLSLPSMHNRP